MNIGARLQAARERRGLSITDVAAATKIQVRYVTAIEQNDHRALPRRPYGRGFVRAYALEVGEDPEGTVRDFFLQFAPPPPPVPPPAPVPPSRRPKVPGEGLRPVARALLLLCLVVGLVAAATLLRAPRSEPEPGQPVGTTGNSTPAVTGATGSAPAPAAPAATPASTPVAVDLEAVGRAWVAANVDGRRAIYRTMQPGEHERLRGREVIAVRVGDAGAIRWRVNGGDLEPMGRRGEVKSVRVSPE
jgi:cytoskeleton protein RodZ